MEAGLFVSIQQSLVNKSVLIFLLAKLKFQALEIIPAHALAAAAIDYSLRDSFDRMLVAQSIIEKIPLVTADKTVQSFPEVDWVW